MEYTTTYSRRAVHLSFAHEGSPLPVDEWDRLEETQHAPQWWLIRELLDNGQAERKGHEVHVLHEEVVKLSRSDQQLLELPDAYPFDIRLDASGTLNRDGFRYKIGFFAHPDGERLPLERTGAILHSGAQEYLLSADQYAFCKAVAEFQEGEETTERNPLRKHSEVKELAQEAGVVMDSYLSKETIVAPDTIEVDLDLDGDAFVMGPRLPGVDNDTLQQKFDRFPKPLSNYPVSDEAGEQVRVAFTDQQQDALSSLKENDRVSGEDRDALIDHPETILDPDVFDLDLFSERVVELGFYEPKFYPFISPYESQWIPGFVVESSPEEREQIRFDTEEELDDFEEALNTAKAEGETDMAWEDVDIPISEAERITEQARRQFEDPETPITEDEDEDQEEDDQVLVIRTNLQEEEYSEAPEVPSTEEFDHAYQSPPRLKETYELRPHQRSGTAWMQSLFGKQYTGGLLADDMGLGKTLQVLSFIKWHRANQNSGGKPYLIVAPVALLENWKNEYQKFFEPSPPPVQVLHGQVLRDYVHGDVEAHWRKGADQLADEGGMHITTYGSLRRYQLLFGAVEWGAVVLDEAQRIKNPTTQVTSAAKALQAEFKLPMTGTPVENSLVDLWSLMDFAVPGLLGSAKEFAKTYQHPLRDEDTDIEALGEQLRNKLGVYIKRRLKAQVIDELPEKEVHRRQRPMPEAQHERYQLEVEHAREAKASGEDGGQAVLKALHAMRLISDHPYLPDRDVSLLDAEELIPKSAKLQQTIEILRSVEDRREKAILYADRKVTQRMLAQVLREAFGIETRVINGDTPAGKTGSKSRQTRQQLIDEFEDRSGFGALVMSPIAAGLGLNITAANHVVHYARHWNPAKEDQATDRVYRIGQPKDVHVYYPMCTIPDEAYQSFDQILDNLLERKRELAEASLFPSERVEVKPDEVYDSVLNKDQGQSATHTSRVDLETACSLDPYLFEALVALLWKNEGYHVRLTPRQSDRGADVAAFQEEGGTLIQVKRQNDPVGPDPVREVFSACAFYEKKFDATFNEKLVVSTTTKYTQGAHELASENGVVLINRGDLGRRIEAHEPTIKGVREQEQRRIESL
jgi:SNF2 family DNA or RNA helicase/HJR/Mrr/RecB family endonuclease